MQIELRFFANFREAVGQKTVQREYENDLQAGDVLRQLSEEFTEMDLFEDGELREYLTILRNGTDIAHLDGEETALEDGDELSVFPPVAGG
ncbi:MoaD family protein [Haloarcula hispanica]|uniref:MoaD/ThiS family protein n=1 Tax=Haloarcula hispanica TaxID=51589 RepID=A0A482TBA9_HALHI|nr:MULTISPECIES: ubiquitin-like small modifier protein 1 [Haloarcula]KAA9410767.1 MoaD/ThiS family protein [Haloarcula hispanica]KZX47340.1 molybdopterin synthase sulfur carrier subunit [Haloarcula sp. K1]MCJ0619852.1 MoaD family protein [Haloarcula hispanica]MUV49045.1 MoaD family protein [Haloarcula sp. CBA1122]RYJ10297.1 MoaD/ThiS family protein [Haloarcula hispanica]